ncbi:hypothetical protein, partial [Acinetobacter baumannii]|uniref:hypothetical protein n=1 Tax=Acinetobacter baumannii TaxID=470 RepID=UPI0022B45F22
PVYLLSGSTLLNLYLKALGAKIGHDVTISSVHIRMPSLLTIEVKAFTWACFSNTVFSSNTAYEPT